jgi:hypothetical protein
MAPRTNISADTLSRPSLHLTGQAIVDLHGEAVIGKTPMF